MTESRMPEGTITEMLLFRVVTCMRDQNPIFPHNFSWKLPTKTGDEELGFGLLASPEHIDALGFILTNIEEKKISEAALAIDRKGEKAHGIEYDRAVTVFHYKDGKWKFGVIEYQFDKETGHKMVKPYNWANAHWRNVCVEEMLLARKKLKDNTLCRANVFEGGSPEELIENVSAGCKSARFANTVKGVDTTVEYPKRGAWAELLDVIATEIVQAGEQPNYNKVIESKGQDLEAAKALCDEHISRYRPQCIKLSRLKEIRTDASKGITKEEATHIRSNCEFCAILMPFLENYQDGESNGT